MPDLNGRYTLAEMRERCRRLLDAIHAEVDPTTGAESATAPLLDELYSNEDLNFFLNSAIAAAWTDTVLSCDTTWADEDYIDIEVDREEYTLPTDMAQLRSLWWKDPGIANSRLPMSRRVKMHLEDEATCDHTAAPTYRRNLNFIRINDLDWVRQANPGGILVRYIKWPLYLIDDGARLETEFARLLQEVIIRGAAIEAIQVKAQLDVSATVKADFAGWVQRLSLAVRNASNPPFIRMVPSRGGHVGWAQNWRGR